jgi:lysine-ketoglutarate reductase/saccharopine dehydrogenase-like protein (TIGR00300 family)
MEECTEEIHLHGHLIDSLIMAKVLDKIITLKGDFDILEFAVGKTNNDPSDARILVKAGSRDVLDHVLDEVKKLGAEIEGELDVALEPAPKDNVFPDDFYSTTNHHTKIRLDGNWIDVAGTRMDSVIVVNTETGEASTKKFKDVHEGDMIVVGSAGVRVIPPEKSRDRSTMFDFMVSKISSEKPSEMLISKLADEIALVKGNVVIVAGPAVIHTGGAAHLASIIEKGYVKALLAGNALATHDIEHALLGTSLGMSLKTGESMEGGHRNHLRAINTIRCEGSIEAAVASGVLTSGIMYACVKTTTPFLLAGSIRDDGPLPEVITDTLVAQARMIDLLDGAEMVLILATTLHGIAVGNLLPSSVKTVCVDINPAVVTKLIDRGSAQTIGIVEDVGLFLAKLDECLP